MPAHAAPRPGRARRRGLSRRTRALLAGGLVLGVGATATLAAWVDTENAAGSFTATVFDTEASVNGTTYADSPTAPGATMSAGSTRYGLLSIRTKTNSTAGSLSIQAATVTNGATDTAPLLGDALRYRVVRSATCTAAAFTGTPTWVVGGAGDTRALNTAQNAGTTVALAAATTTAPGAATPLCFEVTLPAGASNSLQGKSATAVWTVTSTSAQ
jgi:predicted ribosomally synthesized peptide with SipW-like signal peptide